MSDSESLFHNHLPPLWGKTGPSSHFGNECCAQATELLRNQNARLRTSLELERRIVMRLRLEQSNTASEKAESEDFFLKCCEEVKKEIQIRRTRAASEASKARTTDRGKSADNFARQQNARLPRDLTLQDFLKTDRRRLLELIISNDEILAQLHTILFPYRTAGRAPLQPGAQEG
ncbi:putative myosin heavy chain [Toxoplasma gondii TgCatPRC2]|uniref:Myosin heavy chain n=4 Tax=Toxoplasma gondii TaxID=5811 RepID=S8GIG7_TOXGM|nr:hypothetical protein TGME49_254855 [Toxoplasma gondii ME49]EPT31670.1 hypothetical protein TGME49_254855 [Toxoplasma gondii ME49]KFG46619.1 putative myosin heavy chain [Toxoplasma gondii p89]KYF42040.1 putative myosin heavy chain [Toxoplasma gondii ARI]KYK67303.1 putative myosin heavy chain [Toxoplasma gondii TgCatPRC2]|eukprot:XP_018638108.1 hypothetical protein TGME49_254855 [Toxoplasma gondii ME49]